MRSIGIPAHELCSVANDAPRGAENPTENQLVTLPYVNVAVIAEDSTHLTIRFAS
jgi:hypothetical protein